jgi:hypothetical protein
MTDVEAALRSQIRWPSKSRSLLAGPGLCGRWGAWDSNPRPRIMRSSGLTIVPKPGFVGLRKPRRDLTELNPRL